jgi:hypothetical protein
MMIILRQAGLSAGFMAIQREGDRGAQAKSGGQINLSSVFRVRRKHGAIQHYCLLEMGCETNHHLTGIAVTSRNLIRLSRDVSRLSSLPVQWGSVP